MINIICIVDDHSIHTNEPSEDCQHAVLCKHGRGQCMKSNDGHQRPQRRKATKVKSFPKQDHLETHHYQFVCGSTVENRWLKLSQVADEGSVMGTFWMLLGDIFTYGCIWVYLFLFLFLSFQLLADGSKGHAQIMANRINTKMAHRRSRASQAGMGLHNLYGGVINISLPLCVESNLFGGQK